MVDVIGSHALSCKCSSVRLIRHNHLNDIIHRSLSRAGILVTEEPAGLKKTHEKRPDRLTLIPEGRCFIWDATVADTTAASYRRRLPYSWLAPLNQLLLAKRQSMRSFRVATSSCPSPSKLTDPSARRLYGLCFRTRAAHVGHYSEEDGNMFPLSAIRYRSSAINAVCLIYTFSNLAVAAE